MNIFMGKKPATKESFFTYYSMKLINKVNIKLILMIIGAGREKDRCIHVYLYISIIASCQKY